MFSKPVTRVMLALALAAGVVVSAERGSAQAGRMTPRFYPDDPIAVDDDTVADASDASEVELSEAFDFVANTFGSPGDKIPIRAVNVNTLDEVPDSSWFTNRIGVRELSTSEILGGPNK